MPKWAEKPSSGLSKNVLINEAIKIQKELGVVVFVGAIAVHLHSGQGRESGDIDFVVPQPISDQELTSKKYIISNENGDEVIRTPRGVKVDIFAEDLGGISASEIVRTSIEKEIRKGTFLRVIALEGLIKTKHKAQRDQDRDDLTKIVQRRYRDIDWDYLRELSDSDVNFEDIKMTMNYLKE